MELKKYKLGEIATVEISGVDKKIKAGETPVKLCNFVDVYYNWAITSKMEHDFMEATARTNEIERFKLKRGQVALTKDSETRFDIGIATYIADNFDNVILGYHNALITPNPEKLSGKYLNALLHTDYARTYFANNASGSGQRYALSVDALNNFPVPVIPLAEQKRMGDIFSYIDRKISLNRAINCDLEAMAKQIYDYWFVQFDFPDENGNPYKSSGGKMKYDNNINVILPENWTSTNMGALLDILKDGTHNPPKRIDIGVPLLTGTMFGDNFLDYTKATYISYEDYCTIHKQYQPKCNDIILTKIGSLGNVNILTSTDIPIAIHCNSALLRFPEKLGVSYPFFMCKSQMFYNRLKSVKGQSIQEFASLECIASIKIEMPQIALIDKFNNIVNPILKKMAKIREETNELIKQRDELLPLLMNGQVTING